MGSRVHEDPAVLLLDDGELDDVRALLEELAVPFVHLRGGEVPSEVPPPERLFVATSRRAVLAREWPAARAGAPAPRRVCVVTEDSNTLRNMLRRLGFDLLIRRPVHPHALRLVLLRALYGGEERRREDRVAIGYEVMVRSGLRRRAATLADLSLRGCRLLCRHPYAVGSRLTLTIPRDLSDGKPLALRAKVIRSREAQEEGEPGYSLALTFEKVSQETKRRVFRLMKDRQHGPARLARAVERPAPAPPDPAAEAAAAAPVAAPASDVDRRKHRRAPVSLEVKDLDDEVNRALMGRDISLGGMRVDAHPGLDVGTALRLAIYTAPREEPLVVRARVVRDDGAEGLGLRFEEVDPSVGARLEALVAGLPSVESLREGEPGSLGSVVSRILERTGPE